MKFPIDAPKSHVIKAFEILGMERTNPDGTKTPLVLPNHKTIKSSTLRPILAQSDIERIEFLDVIPGLIYADTRLLF